MEQHWAPIWRQAMSRSFLNGKAFGRDKTAVFSVSAPVSGDSLRIRFSNRFGAVPYAIGALRVFAGGRSCQVTLGGQQHFAIPAGGVTLSDPCALPVQRGEEIELRLYYTNAINDSNMIEEEANLLPGDQTARSGNEALRRPLLAKYLGAYNAIPAVEAVEVLTEEPAKAIVAFGDSITAMSRWTKPVSTFCSIPAYPATACSMREMICSDPFSERWAQRDSSGTCWRSPIWTRSFSLWA